MYINMIQIFNIDVLEKWIDVVILYLYMNEIKNNNNWNWTNLLSQCFNIENIDKITLIIQNCLYFNMYVKTNNLVVL